MYPPVMSRFTAWSLLAVFGIGVFLAGLELMITATALPSILLDLAITDQIGKPAFSELRHASWIINGYLLAYVVAMPLAGRLADVWGARRLFLTALVVFIVGSLAAALGATTLIGVADLGGPDPLQVGLALTAVAVVATILTVIRGFRRSEPFLDPRLFRRPAFTSAALVSLLTGYAFATAIIGGAVFVDRVLYGGPNDQRFALGSLAAATALGALVSGFAVRVLSLRLVTLVGLLVCTVALALMARWTPAVSIVTVALVLGSFGLGFGLTVTPRSTAAVESAGRASFGMASAIVTVARMIGMAVGVSVLTAYGSTQIDRLYDRLFAVDPEGWKTVIPADLRDRGLHDGLVVNALESWAANEASGILVGMFLAAGVVTVVAIPPGLALGGRTRRLSAGSIASAVVATAEAGGTSSRDGADELESTIPL